MGGQSYTTDVTKTFFFGSINITQFDFDELKDSESNWQFSVRDNTRDKFATTFPSCHADNQPLIQLFGALSANSRGETKTIY